jgi:hypothetical protein
MMEKGLECQVKKKVKNIGVGNWVKVRFSLLSQKSR